LKGQVIRYADVDGNTIELSSGIESKVVDSVPEFPAWGLEDPVLVELPPRKTISRAEFVDLLTPVEVGSVMASAAWLFNEQELDMNGEVIIAWLSDMEATGLLVEGRADEIRALSMPATEI